LLKTEGLGVELLGAKAQQHDSRQADNNLPKRSHQALLYLIRLALWNQDAHDSNTAALVALEEGLLRAVMPS
jgi:hypothetical protein